MRLLYLFALAAALPLAAQTPASLPEPQVNPDQTVTFRYMAPAATRVALSLENVPTPIPMAKGEGGTWMVTTPVLKPEYYSYSFVVDGREAIDPLNRSGLDNLVFVGSTFLVPSATGPALWQRTAVPHGVLHHHTYTSKVVLGLHENQDDFYVYTPPGYDPRAATRYPVLYLLHGWSDSAAGWTSVGHANDILDNLIAQGKARPMIVVMPLGYGDMSFVRQGFGVWDKPEAVDHNTAYFSEALLNEVMPQAEKLYNVSARREDRAIAGLSMGGLEALTIGLNHADMFAWVGGFSAAVHLVKPQAFVAIDPKKAALKLLYISCGTEDGLLQPNRKLVASLQAQGLTVKTKESAGIGHVWLEWRPDLADFASTIFP